MPSISKLMNGDRVYAKHHAITLVRAAAGNPVLTASSTDDDPDTHVVVSNILTAGDASVAQARIRAPDGS